LILSQIMPVFLFVAMGYAFKVFKRDISDSLIEFVIYFSLPALALVKIRELKFDDIVLNIILISYIAMTISAIISFLVAKILKLDRKTLVTFMVVSTFGNTSFVGFSYVESLYSSNELSYALVYDQIGSFVALLTIGMVLISWGANKEIKQSALQKIKMILTPPFVSILLALMLQGVEFPLYVENILKKLEMTLIPLVTIIVGMKLEIKGFKKYFKESMLVLLIKMVLSPILLFGISYLFWDMNQTWLKVTLLEASMPPMTMAVLFAIRAGLNKDLAINSLGLGILVSFVLVPLWNSLL